jgi:hypothetical protein
MLHEPCLRGPPQPPLLLQVDHVQRVAEAGAGLLLDLAEHEPPPAAGDDVQLVAAGPDVPAEDPVAAQAVPEHGAPLGAPAAAGVAHAARLR